MSCSDFPRNGIIDYSFITVLCTLWSCESLWVLDYVIIPSNIIIKYSISFFSIYKDIMLYLNFLKWSEIFKNYDKRIDKLTYKKIYWSYHKDDCLISNWLFWWNKGKTVLVELSNVTIFNGKSGKMKADGVSCNLLYHCS